MADCDSECHTWNMAASFAAPFVRRGEVPLTEDDVEALNLAAGHFSLKVLSERWGVLPSTELPSESALLHALLAVGLMSLREAREEAGYARLVEDTEYVKRATDLYNNRSLKRRPPYADEE